MNSQQKKDTATLEILQVIESNKDITQRHLAGRLDIALGLANSYLKRCVRKGLIKIHQTPANRYFYYLTSKGFAEKSRLTGQYLSLSFDFYRKASDSIKDVFEKCHQNNWEKVIFCGVSELAEIASIRLNEYGLIHVATYQSNAKITEFLCKPVWGELPEENTFDVVVLTSLVNVDLLHKKIDQLVKNKKILIPSILGIVN